MEEICYNSYLISLRTNREFVGLLLHCKIKLAYVLGINVVKWTKELAKIYFSVKKKNYIYIHTYDLFYCTETFLPGN